MNLKSERRKEGGGGYKKDGMGGKGGRVESPPLNANWRRLLGLCRGPIFLDKLSSSQLDREKHHINCYTCTKAWLFNPLSTNLLY